MHHSISYNKKDLNTDTTLTLTLLIYDFARASPLVIGSIRRVPHPHPAFPDFCQRKVAEKLRQKLR